MHRIGDWPLPKLGLSLSSCRAEPRAALFQGEHGEHDCLIGEGAKPL